MSELVTKKELMRILKISEPTLRKLIKSDRLPDPIDLGDRTRRWRRADIDEWLKAGCPAKESA